MQSSTNEKSSPPVMKNRSVNDRSIFIYLCSHRFWLGLFDTADLSFIRNLFIHTIVEQTDVLMTIFVPENATYQRVADLLKKEEQLKLLASQFGAEINFLHLRGRNIKDILNTPSKIHQLTQYYGRRFIWAKNYFNCFIGVITKSRYPDIRLHFDMSGLVPEEVLYYSKHFIGLRILYFLVLKFIERINCRKADSVSVVSRRFKDYIITQHRLPDHKVSITPVFFDYEKFFLSQELRGQIRSKYRIGDEQKLILYSGTLVRWQEPDRLFAFFKHIQQQDEDHEFRFMILTFDQTKANHYKEKYRIDGLIIETANAEQLNGYYNAADIGIAIRSADKVSFLSSPVKIPEYLSTGNSLISLEYVGDFGTDLAGKDFVLMKKDMDDLLATGIEEVRRLKKPAAADLEEILSNYSSKKNIDVIKRIVNYNQTG